MKKLIATSAALSLACAAFITGATGAAAAVVVGNETPTVIGGERAPETPWAVQIKFSNVKGTFGCTGEAIASDWILTAKHCIKDVDEMTVYFSNDTANRGEGITADRLIASPAGGDVALVHLSASAPIYSFPSVAESYTATSGDTATLMGYGNRAYGSPTDGLYQATVEITGEKSDAFSGNGIHVVGVTGASNHGDSGGPLLVNGEIVGVCSTGDVADKGGDIHAGTTYANLSASRSWIRETTGA